jgi:hypothetical protein
MCWWVVRFQATRRLLRDWKEVQKEPIKTVKASPLENDLRSVPNFATLERNYDLPA